MTISKIKDFYVKYKIIIILTTITTLLFFANFFNPLWIVAAAIMMMFYLTCNINELFCYTMYFEAFSGIGTFFIVNLLEGFLVIVFKYILDVVKKQQKIHFIQLFLTMFIILLFGLIHYEVDVQGFFLGSIIVAMLMLVYFVYSYYKQLDVDECFKFLLLGLIVSLILSLISLLFDNFGYCIFHFDGTYNRLRLFAYHENHIAMLCAFLVAYQIYKICNKKGKLWQSVVVIIVALCLGIFTLSKAFIIVCFGFVGYICIYLICRYKWKSLKFIIPLMVVLVLFCLIFKNYFLIIYDRIFAYYNKNSIICKLTTGRSGIWQTYLDFSKSSFLKLLFGAGLYTKDAVDIGPHNIFLFLLYRLGVIGIILLGVLIYFYAKQSNYKLDFSYKKILPFLTFIIFGLEEMILSDRFFYFLIYAILLMIVPKNKPVLSTPVTQNVKTTKAVNTDDKTNKK